MDGTRDVWVRDFLPVPIDEDGNFVRFRYAPDYMRGYDDLVTNARDLISRVPEIRRCEFSVIVLDCGNVVWWRETAIATDKIYKENPRVERAYLRDRLRRAFASRP